MPIKRQLYAQEELPLVALGVIDENPKVYLDFLVYMLQPTISLRVVYSAQKLYSTYCFIERLLEIAYLVRPIIRDNRIQEVIEIDIAVKESLYNYFSVNAYKQLKSNRFSKAVLDYKQVSYAIYTS